MAAYREPRPVTNLSLAQSGTFAAAGVVAVSISPYQQAVAGARFVLLSKAKAEPTTPPEGTDRD